MPDVTDRKSYRYLRASALIGFSSLLLFKHRRRVRRREQQRVEYTWTMDPKFSLTTSPVLTPQLKALLILYLITAITSDPWTQAIQPPNYMRQEFMFVPPTVNNNNRQGGLGINICHTG